MVVGTFYVDTTVKPAWFLHVSIDFLASNSKQAFIFKSVIFYFNSSNY